MMTQGWLPYAVCAQDVPCCHALCPDSCHGTSWVGRYSTARTVATRYDRSGRLASDVHFSRLRVWRLTHDPSVSGRLVSSQQFVRSRVWRLAHDPSVSGRRVSDRAVPVFCDAVRQVERLHDHGMAHPLAVFQCPFYCRPNVVVDYLREVDRFLVAKH